MFFLSLISLLSCHECLGFWNEIYDHKSIVALYGRHVTAKSFGRESELDNLLRYLHDSSMKADPNAPKHVLTIMTDDQGWNDVGYHDSTFVTPTIDMLANEGIKLNNFYVQVS
jgi:hypothetical protein